MERGQSVAPRVLVVLCKRYKCCSVLSGSSGEISRGPGKTRHAHAHAHAHARTYILVSALVSCFRTR